ncbi:TPA: restriction endonuclease subunit S [Enterococcus faecium]|uniref:restriction endonuclease subunit S n=1 Tax=Enterococcus TaxID=1350 RepID=UPI001899D86C|nr:restriction endonuclease subunit S [Enterococcus mundtii]
MSNDTQPEIRFPGFTDDWEERKLKDIFDIHTDFVSNGSFQALKDNVKLYKTENYAYMIRLQDASNNWSGPWLYTDKQGFDFLSKSMVYKDDILMSDRGTIGKFFLVPQLDKPMTLSSNAVLLRSTKNDNNFIYYMLNTSNISNQIIVRTTPGVQPMISKTEFKKINTRIPNIQEQQKIGSFFKQLDNTIALHQRKLDLLKETKKGFLQKMFPKNGAKVPEVRFPGFTGDWEQRKLIDVANYRNGKAHEKDISKDGDYIVVNSKFVSTNGTVKKFSDSLIEPLIKGEIAFVLSDVPNGKAIARTFLVDKNEKYSLNQRIAGITPTDETDSYYLYILMNRHPYFLKFDNGVGQTNLSKKEVENFETFYPSFEEQQKIGRFFKTLDDAIALHQRKLDLLKETKKGFLQKMFV